MRFKIAQKTDAKCMGYFLYSILDKLLRKLVTYGIPMFCDLFFWLIYAIICLIYYTGIFLHVLRCLFWLIYEIICLI